MRVLMQLQPNMHNPAALLQGLLPLCFKYNDVRCTIDEKRCETVFGY